MQVAWQQIGGIGLEQKLMRGYGAHERQEMCAAPFVADPAGDADEQLHFEVALKFAGSACEAMRHCTAEAAAVFAQDRDEVRMGIALMEEDGFTGSGGEFQLPLEGVALHRGRRKVALVIKTTLADGDDFGMRGEERHIGRHLC